MKKIFIISAIALTMSLGACSKKPAEATEVETTTEVATEKVADQGQVSQQSDEESDVIQLEDADYSK